MPDQSHLIDSRIRQTPLNRWENEGGATVTGHEVRVIKALISHPTLTIEPKRISFK